MRIVQRLPFLPSSYASPLFSLEFLKFAGVEISPLCFICLFPVDESLSFEVIYRISYLLEVSIFKIVDAIAPIKFPFSTLFAPKSPFSLFLSAPKINSVRYNLPYPDKS